MTPEELAALVAKMRELGVTEASGIKLGAPPSAPAKEETKEEYLARVERLAQRQHDAMFAASGTKPKLRMVKP